MKKTIRIFGREKQSQDGKTKFTSWSYTKDGVEFYDVKFTQECTTAPKKPGYWLITFDTNEVSKERKKRNQDGFKYNDVLWFRAIISATYDEDYAKEVEAERQAEIDELFK